VLYNKIDSWLSLSNISVVTDLKHVELNFSSELRHRAVWYITIVSDPILPRLAFSITNFSAVKIP
jgi:hypothetical protein